MLIVMMRRLMGKRRNELAEVGKMSKEKVFMHCRRCGSSGHNSRTCILIGCEPPKHVYFSIYFVFFIQILC